MVIATKLDKIKRSQQQKQLKIIRQTLEAGPDTVIIPFSATEKKGVDEFYACLEEDLASVGQ